MPLCLVHVRHGLHAYLFTTHARVLGFPSARFARARQGMAAGEQAFIPSYLKWNDIIPPLLQKNNLLQRLLQSELHNGPI